jgi:hypothetical protein
MDELERLARMVLVLPNGGCPAIYLGTSDAAVSLLSTVPGARTQVFPYHSDLVIDSVGATVLGVEFRAQRLPRPVSAAAVQAVIDSVVPGVS